MSAAGNWIVGRTTAGQPVVSGAQLFALHDRDGFPLAASLAECERRGCVVDWMGFLRAGLGAGRSIDTLRRMAAQGLADSGFAGAEEINRRLALIEP